MDSILFLSLVKEVAYEKYYPIFVFLFVLISIQLSAASVTYTTTAFGYQANKTEINPISFSASLSYIPSLTLPTFNNNNGAYVLNSVQLTIPQNAITFQVVGTYTAFLPNNPVSLLSSGSVTASIPGATGSAIGPAILFTQLSPPINKSATAGTIGTTLTVTDPLALSSYLSSYLSSSGSSVNAAINYLITFNITNGTYTNVSFGLGAGNNLPISITYNYSILTPEPGTYLVLGSMLFGLSFIACRKKLQKVA